MKKLFIDYEQTLLIQKELETQIRSQILNNRYIKITSVQKPHNEHLIGQKFEVLDLMTSNTQVLIVVQGSKLVFHPSNIEFISKEEFREEPDNVVYLDSYRKKVA